MSSTPIVGAVVYRAVRSNYLEISDVVHAGQVCKKWEWLLSCNPLWKPIFANFFPWNDREFGSKESIKSVVLDSLKKERGMVNDRIILLLKAAMPYVNVDKQLATIIGSSDP